MKRDALLGNIIPRFQALHILKPAILKFSKLSLIKSNFLYSLWKYSQSDLCFVWCCHRSLRKERTNDISWTVVWLHVNQVLILNTTAPKTFIKPKLVASHAADIQSPRKSYWDSLAPPTSDQLGPLQMQSNGFFGLLNMVFSGLFSWGQSGVISKIENIKSLTFASPFRITEHLKGQNIFVRKELIYILKSSRHLKSIVDIINTAMVFTQ